MDWMTYEAAVKLIGQAMLDALIASGEVVVEHRADGLFVPRVTVEEKYRVGHSNIVADPTGFSEPTAVIDQRNLGPQGPPVSM